jgi:hypothetical protein
LGDLTDAYTEVAMRLGVIQPTSARPPTARTAK